MNAAAEIIAGEARLHRAVRRIAVQTGHAPEALLDWLCEGGLAASLLAYATQQKVVAAPAEQRVQEPPRAPLTPPSAHPALMAANDWAELVEQWDSLPFGTQAYYDALALCDAAWERIARACGVPAEAATFTELVQQIREAAGDPRGKLMQDELVASIARAFEIADEAMYELAHSEAGSRSEPDCLGLMSEDCHKVHALADASQALRDAVEWLQPRGFVRVESDEHGEFVRVLRELV